MRNKDYEEKISKLEVEVGDLKRGLRLCQMTGETYWNQYLGECHHFETFQLNEVVKLILNHLGLKLKLAGPELVEVEGEKK